MITDIYVRVKNKNRLPDTLIMNNKLRVYLFVKLKQRRKNLDNQKIIFEILRKRVGNQENIQKAEVWKLYFFIFKIKAIIFPYRAQKTI